MRLSTADGVFYDRGRRRVPIDCVLVRGLTATAAKHWEHTVETFADEIPRRVLSPGAGTVVVKGTVRSLRKFRRDSYGRPSAVVTAPPPSQ